MPSELRQLEINLRNALDRRIATEEETIEGLITSKAEVGQCSETYNLIDEAQARRRAYDIALWELNEALMQISSNSISRRRKVLDAIERLDALKDAHEGYFRQTVQQTLHMILEEML